MNYYSFIFSDRYLPNSIADELRKLALRSEEILTEQEFQHIKQELIRKVSRTQFLIFAGNSPAVTSLHLKKL